MSKLSIRPVRDGAYWSIADGRAYLQRGAARYLFVITGLEGDPIKLIAHSDDEAVTEARRRLWLLCIKNEWCFVWLVSPNTRVVCTCENCRRFTDDMRAAERGQWSDQAQSLIQDALTYTISEDWTEEMRWEILKCQVRSHGEILSGTFKPERLRDALLEAG